MDYDQPRPPPPPPYAMLSEQGSPGNSMNLRPPPQRRNLPRYYSGQPEKHGPSGCRRCCCWFCCFLLIFLLLLIAIAVYFFLIYKPQVPTYSVDNLSVESLNINPAAQTLQLQLTVEVKAVNPNSVIGIWYDTGSQVLLQYRNSTLSSGQLPSFYQGFRKTAMMRVAMHGDSKLESGLTKALQENMRTGETPLDVFVRAPVKLRIGSVDLREVKVNVRCMLVVGSLRPNQKVAIKSSQYEVDVEF